MPRPVNLSLELLKTFLQLAHNDGDAAQAAKELEINQPSMSKRLRYLQHAGPVLDHPWLVRAGKTWKLTDEGRKVLPAVEEIVQRFEKLSGFIEDPGTVPQQLKFACGQQAVLGFVRRAVRGFRRQHPDIQLRISTLRGSARIEGVANGSLDLATVTHEEREIAQIARRPLHVETICSDRLVLVSMDPSPWSAKLRKLPKTKVSADKLMDFPLLLPEPDAGTRQDLDRVLRELNLLGKLDIALEIGGWSSILAYVQDGFGVGLVSEAALPDTANLVVRYLDPDVIAPIEVKLICRRSVSPERELDLAPAGEKFRAALKEAATPRGE